MSEENLDNASMEDFRRMAAVLVRVEALRDEWRCNCGGPSPEGHHEMHCDSYYGDYLRDVLRGDA